MSCKPFILGFSGKMRSGKTTSARFLQSRCGGSTVFSFSAKLKAIVRRDWPEFTDEEIFRTKPPRVRRVLIEEGQNKRRLDSDYWIRPLARLVEDGYPGAVFVDDVRFRNEADFIREHDGMLVRLERPGGRMLEDESETALDDYPHFHFEVVNAGTLTQLYEKLDGIFGVSRMCRGIGSLALGNYFNMGA